MNRREQQWEARCAADLARGVCPDSGLPQHACHLGPCDCFEPDSCAACLLIFTPEGCSDGL